MPARKRKLECEDSPKQPPKKRQKRNPKKSKSKTKKQEKQESPSIESDERKSEETSIEREEKYEECELRKLKNKELKELLKKKKFIISGNKELLIKRLLDPDFAILEMKWSHHRMICNKGNMSHIRYLPKKHKDAAALHIQRMTFNPSRYEFVDGKIFRLF